jgi:hypothetical protein
MRLAPYLRGSVVALAIVTWAAASIATPAKGGDSRPWLEQFGEKNDDLVSRGTSRYWVLEPGYQLRLEGREKGKKVVLLVSVLSETKRVDGVETRVVEERETADGKLDEVSRNYFAISQRTKNVYYFGEDVDTYRNGKVANHEGTWLAGKSGARYGLAMPASPEKGFRFYQELAPKVAMDRCEIAATDEQLDTPYGSLAHVVKVEETTPLEPGSREYKYYAPGIGIVQDAELKLVSIVKPTARVPATGAPQAARVPEGAPGAGAAGQPLVPEPEARAALDFVGIDPEAEATWYLAINDPNLSPDQRKDLIEDLNENGFPDPAHLTVDDLPLIESRLQLIEELAPEAMDQVNLAAFQEAYKDLTNMHRRLSRR